MGRQSAVSFKSMRVVKLESVRFIPACRSEQSTKKEQGRLP